MIRIYAVAIALFLGGCASAPTDQDGESSGAILINFSGANDEGGKGAIPTKMQQMVPLQEWHGDVNLDFPLTRAVKCEAKEGKCEQAVVSASLEFKYSLTGPKKVCLSGSLMSQMGRSLSVEGKNFNQVRSVSASVPLIDDVTKRSPIDVCLKQGESHAIGGLGGVTVTVTNM